MRFLSKLCAIVVYLCSICGCIAPPPEVASNYLPANEVLVASLLKRAEYYLRSGRPDLAEVDFRKAINVSPELPNALNNLGYVLLEQNRSYEAQDYFRQVLLYDPNNSAAIGNYIRARYELGAYDEVIKSYHLLLKGISPISNNALPPTVKLKLTGDNDSLAQVYRDLASVYYVIGDIENAICYSELSVIASNSPIYVLRHARLLLSVNEIKKSMRFLKQLVNGSGGNTNTAISDYSLTLYLAGDKLLAEQAADRVIGYSASSNADRLTTSMVKLLIIDERVIGEKDSKEKFAIMVESLLDAFPKLCPMKIAKFPLHWPEIFIEKVRYLSERICDEKFESSL